MCNAGAYSRVPSEAPRWWHLWPEAAHLSLKGWDVRIILPESRVDQRLLFYQPQYSYR